jgi:hypothetical protein
MHPRAREILPYVVLLAVTGLLYWASTRIQADTGGRIGPSAWPKAIIVVMGLLCAYEIVKRLVIGSASSAKGLVSTSTALPVAAAASAEPPAAEREYPRMLYGGMAMVVAYVVAVPWLGFFVTTALFLALFPWVGGMRRPVLTGAIGLAGSLLLVVVFMRVAYISLPLGEGPFRSLSLALLRAIGVS